MIYIMLSHLRVGHGIQYIQNIKYARGQVKYTEQGNKTIS